MEESREESESVGDCKEPMVEASNGLGLSSQTETLVVDDANTVELSDLGVSDDNNPNDEEDTADVKSTDAITDPETVMECQGDEETVISVANEATDDKAKCVVEDNGGVCDADQNVETDGETLSVAQDKADKEEATKKSEEDYNKMGDDSQQGENESNEMNVALLHQQGNPGYETKDAKHSEESTQLSKETTEDEENQGPVLQVCSAAENFGEEEKTNLNQKEETGEAMETDYAAEEQVQNHVQSGGTLDDESAAASMVQTEDVPIAEADTNDSNVVKEMEIGESKDNADMASDLTGTVESADSANPNSPTEDAAPGEVEPLDHNGLFDPTSDITNFIDFSGVSSWSGNIQDLKTETGNVSLKEDKKATDIENESNEAPVAFGEESPAAATDCSKEASDAILGSDENLQGKNHESLDKKPADQQDTMREEDDTTHEAPSIDSNQKEDTEMEENLNNSDYADNETGSEIKTNGVKRKADVLSEVSPGEGRKTVSFAKVSFAERPSFKIGACIARAASQMAGSPSVLKGGNFGDETLSVESFVSQLQCAATDPVKENIVSDIAVGFFLDFRNSSASQVTPEMISSKRARLSNSNAGGTEAFEFEEMGDTYWTDRVIHNGGEEQTPPTEKGNYQVVPVELKAAQVQRTRRPYRRRQSQISIPHSASKKPADFDENAPAELIMNFCETDTIPPEKSLSKMFRHFGPIRESKTEVDMEKHRARVVFQKGADAEVAYNSAGRFNIFGTKAVKYEVSHTITETFKVQPYVVSLGEEDEELCPPS